MSELDQAPKEDDPTTIAYSASAAEAEKRAQEALEADATLYDYDAAYDALHAVNAAKKAAERDNAAERKPKYMDALFESAEQRKKDQLRARDKLIQRKEMSHRSPDTSAARPCGVSQGKSRHANTCHLLFDFIGELGRTLA